MQYRRTQLHPEFLCEQFQLAAFRQIRHGVPVHELLFHAAAAGKEHNAHRIRHELHTPLKHRIAVKELLPCNQPFRGKSLPGPVFEYEHAVRVI